MAGNTNKQPHDLSQVWGSHKPYTWTREHFLQVVLTGKKPIVRNQPLAEALKAIDRRKFLPEKLQASAYNDGPLHLDDGTTIPTPVVLAELIDQLDLKPGDKVLELGAGTGYTTALVSHCVGGTGTVFAVERNQYTLEQTRKNLAAYPELKNYELIFKDGAEGLLAKAPYDAILINFAFESPPIEILQQLKISGRLVMPLTNMNINLYVRESEDEVTAKLISVKQFRKVQYGVE